MAEKLRMALERVWEDVKRYWGVVLGVAVYGAVVLACFGAFCPVVILTGLPCPGCGMTRALVCVLLGKWREAWGYHPCIYLWVALAAVAAWNRYWRGRRTQRLLWLIGGIAVCMVGCYLYRMAVLFPGSAPLVWRENSVLGRAFPFYNDLLRGILGL